MLTVRYGTLGLRPGERMLDLGCGGGRHAFEAMRHGAQVVAVDPDAGEVEGAAALMAALALEDERTLATGGTGTAVKADALSLPFEDGSFDRIIAAEVLEHIVEDVQAMRELSRVLRPGGTIAVTVPRFGPEAVNWALSEDYYRAPGGHVRIYRRSVLRSRLEDAGLRVYATHHAHSLHSPYWWLKCAVGLDRSDHQVLSAYHRLLVWDITKGSVLTRAPERLLNPLMGKSLVLYLRRSSGGKATDAL